LLGKVQYFCSVKSKGIVRQDATRAGREGGGAPLDGYVADPDDGVAEVFDWYFTSGDVEIHTGGSDPMTFDSSTASPARQSSSATRW